MLARSERGLTVILGSGPSLTAAQAESVRGCRVIVINSTYRLAPWADALYGCARWWPYHIGYVRQSFRGELWTEGEDCAKQLGLHRIRSARGVGLSRDPAVVYQGGGLRGDGNSGYQAINLAYHWGARRIVLLGFDMKLGPGGERNHHASHVIAETSPYAAWVVNMHPLAADLASEGVEVLNATPGSALDCFPLVSLDEVI